MLNKNNNYIKLTPRKESEPFPKLLKNE
jgi:hypothetical protein